MLCLRFHEGQLRAEAEANNRVKLAEARAKVAEKAAARAKAMEHLIEESATAAAQASAAWAAERAESEAKWAEERSALQVRWRLVAEEQTVCARAPSNVFCAILTTTPMTITPPPTGDPKGLVALVPRRGQRAQE